MVIILSSSANIAPLYSFTLDAHYRNYFGQRLKGFYISGFGRLAALHGSAGDGFACLFDSSQQYQQDTELKFGLGFGIGYRVISKSGWYWGTSLSVGRYFVGENNKVVSRSGSPFGGTEIEDRVVRLLPF